MPASNLAAANLEGQRYARIVPGTLRLTTETRQQVKNTSRV